MFLLVQDGTLRGNKWPNNAACACIWKLSCSLHVNQRRPDVLLAYMQHIWAVTAVHWCGLMAPLDLTSPGNGVSHCDLLRVVPFFCLFIPWLSFLPLFTQVFICLLQPAYGLLYYSWAPYCFFGWCRMHVFAAISPTTSLATPHLQFNRAKLQDHCWFLHSFLMFAPISSHLMLVYNQIKVLAVLNKTVNQTWAQLSDTQFPYLKFHLNLTWIVYLLTQTQNPKPKW